MMMNGNLAFTRHIKGVLVVMPQYETLLIHFFMEKVCRQNNKNGHPDDAYDCAGNGFMCSAQFSFIARP